MRDSYPSAAFFTQDSTGKLLRALLHFPWVEEKRGAHRKKHRGDNNKAHPSLPLRPRGKAALHCLSDAPVIKHSNSTILRRCGEIGIWPGCFRSELQSKTFASN